MIAACRSIGLTTALLDAARRGQHNTLSRRYSDKAEKPTVHTPQCHSVLPVYCTVAPSCISLHERHAYCALTHVSLRAVCGTRLLAPVTSSECPVNSLPRPPFIFHFKISILYLVINFQPSCNRNPNMKPF